jgi:phage virion morphogenesis protein
MIHVTVQSYGLNKKITDIARRCANTAAAMREIGTHMERSVRKNFEKGGRPHRWAPLAESTKRKKTAKRGTWQPILVDDGTMRDKIKSNTGINYSITRSPSYYNIYHHFGTTNMPQRQFMVIQPEDETIITSIMLKYIIGGVG